MNASKYNSYASARRRMVLSPLGFVGEVGLFVLDGKTHTRPTESGR
jgi:hypothetical protein